MFRAAIVWAALLQALAATAHAAPGVSLRWDNCYSDSGVANKTFACDANTGSERLVMSLTLGSSMPNVDGLETRLFIVPASPTLPAWWDLTNLGTCRPRALTMTMVPPPGSVNCVDWGNGNAAGGIGSYTVGDIIGANNVIIRLAAAVPGDLLVTLDADREYFTGSLVISHAKTVSAGSCGGCDQPVCLVLDRQLIVTPIAANNVVLFDPAYGPDSDFARWQNGQETNVQILNCDGHNFGCFHSYTCQLSSTPTRASTWGAVKALYR